MEIKSKNPVEKKVIKTISVDPTIFKTFQDEMKKRNYGVSEILSEFMKRVGDLGSAGGEVVFGVAEAEHIGYSSDGNKKVYRQKLDITKEVEGSDKG